MPQLPTELLAGIFSMALPSVDFMKHATAFRLLRRIRMLYTLRSVAKRWQNIIDGTPTFWTYVQSTLPPHVNEATIIRSGNGPLTVVYPYTTAPKAYDPVSPEQFLLSFAHTFHRWAEYSGPVVPGYLDKPAPHLTKISLRNEDSRIEPFELLGGSATNLRYVDLDEVPIRWKRGILNQLQVLKLAYAGGSEGLTTTHILETLLASPCLEYLELDHVSATIEAPPYSQAISLPNLRYINFSTCEYDFTGAILRHMRAPSCIEFYLDVFLDGEGEEDHQLLNEDLQAFHELLRAIHNRNGSSEIILDAGNFKWQSSPGGFESDPTLSIVISCDILVHCIRWVERVLQRDPGLSIHFTPHTSASEDILRRIALMQCVTRLEIEDIPSVADLSSVLKLIGKPLSSNPSLPSLPCLRELLLTGIGWSSQSLLNVVHSRFKTVSWGSVERTPLTIKISRGAFHSGGFSLGGHPRPILDLTTLIRMREIDGVERVQFFGPEQYDGMLAIAWDEKTSKPVWVWG